MERDDETGMQYHSQRYYMPWLGRWERADPIGLNGGHNAFLYSRGSPSSSTDRGGLSPSTEGVKEDENVAQIAPLLPPDVTVDPGRAELVLNRGVVAGSDREPTSAKEFDAVESAIVERALTPFRMLLDEDPGSIVISRFEGGGEGEFEHAAPEDPQRDPGKLRFNVVGFFDATFSKEARDKARGVISQEVAQEYQDTVRTPGQGLGPKPRFSAPKSAEDIVIHAVVGHASELESAVRGRLAAKPARGYTTEYSHIRRNSREETAEAIRVSLTTPSRARFRAGRSYRAVRDSVAEELGLNGVQANRWLRQRARVLRRSQRVSTGD